MTRSSRSMSARARVLWAVLGVAGIGMAIAGGVTFLVQRDRVLAEVDDRLYTQVAHLRTVAGIGEADSTSIDERIDVDDYATVQDFLDEVVTLLAPARNEASVGIVDGVALPQPERMSGFDLGSDTTLIAQAVAEAARAQGPVIGTAAAKQGLLRYIAVPVSKSGDPRTGVYMRAVDIGAELAPVTVAVITYTISSIAVLGAIGVAGWFVTGRLLSPIRELRETADTISITDLSPRLPAEGNDEIADLSRTVNSMLDRLEGSVDVQRQLLDDVRHELKTPITIVRGHLEMMDASDEADVRNTREIGIAELDRMTRLVNDIDLLAAVEGDALTAEEFDLGALTERVGELVTAIPGHSWTVEQHANGRITGDHDRLLQAWLQLADNASKYTPEGSPIEIGSALTAVGAQLWVRDHGPGIPPAFRHRIFRRFDRAQGKRSVGGSGLGLAIVDAITKGHGGQCTVTDTPGGGATFTIVLPLPTAELPAPVRAGDVVLQREASG